MNVKKQILNAVMCATVGMFGLGLASCNNSRELPVDSGEKTHKVTTEAFFLQEDGTLVPFSSNDLRATTKTIEGDKGKIEGAGTYFHSESATIKASPKDKYKLFSLYEKDGAGGHTQENGKPQSGETSKTITINVEKDLHFIAVFMGVEGVDREYRNLKLNGTNGNFNAGEFDGSKASNGSITAIGEEYVPLRDYSGKIQEWSLNNGEFKNWAVKPINASWIKVNAKEGAFSYFMDPFISKTEGSREVTVQVGKDGVGEGKGVWRTITFKQSSYWGFSQDPTNPRKINDASGSVISLPKSLRHTFDPHGGAIQLKTLDKSFAGPIYAYYEVYVNGKLQPESQWIKKEIVPSYSAAPAWLTANGPAYKAGMNTGKETRNGSVVVTWKVDGNTVGTTTISFDQAPVQYNVDGTVK